MNVVEYWRLNFRQFQSFLYEGIELSANLIEADHSRVNTSTEVMKDAWEFAGSSNLSQEAGVIEAGLPFMSVDVQKKCKPTIIFTQKNFNIVSTSADLVYLIYAIPRTKCTGICRTNKEIRK